MFSEFNGDLIRDPARKNVGKFVTLPDFLEFAKAKAVPGVLINIEVIFFSTLLCIDIYTYVVRSY